jgi:hypothetical protein
MSTGTKDFLIRKGETFSQALRWEAPPIIWKEITAISQTAPARLTVPAHGCKPNWRVKVSTPKSMRELDEVTTQATVIDADTVELNTVNASSYKPYTGGGYLSFNTPVDMTGMAARMSIKTKVGGELLLSLTSLNGDIVVDEVNCTITLKLTAEVTAALTWKGGFYDLEMVAIDGSVTRLLQGKVRVVDEVTT